MWVIMWAGHGVNFLISQYVSTIKSPGVYTVGSQSSYDIGCCKEVTLDRSINKFPTDFLLCSAIIIDNTARCTRGIRNDTSCVPNGLPTILVLCQWHLPVYLRLSDICLNPQRVYAIYNLLLIHLPINVGRFPNSAAYTFQLSRITIIHAK